MMDPLIVPLGFQGEACLMFRVRVLEGLVHWLMSNAVMVQVITEADTDRMLKTAEAEVRKEYEVDA